MLEGWGDGTIGTYYLYKDEQLLTQVVLDESMKEARPTNTACWFSRMANLERIEHLDYLNTSEVTDMNRMFAGCSKLEWVNIRDFDLR